MVGNSFEDEANEDNMKKKKYTMRPLPQIDSRPPNTQYDMNYNGIEYDIPAMEGFKQDKLSECPLLGAMETRCRGIDLLSGDLHQELLSVCGVHQLCYLCVSICYIRHIHHPKHTFLL